MTISSIQAVSFTAIRLSIGARTAATATSSATTTPTAEQVTLSPGTAAEGTATTPPPVDPPPPTNTQRRADALFGALDADHDGSITGQEFTDGAIALLRWAGDQHRSKGHDVEGRAGNGHESRRLHRLERKLEKAFDRIDANQDGAIDKDELTTATSPTTVTFSFTYVAVAVQRYTALQTASDPAVTTPAAPTSPAAGDTTVDPAAAAGVGSPATTLRSA